MYPNNRFDPEPEVRRKTGRDLAYQCGVSRRTAGLYLSPNPYDNPVLRAEFERGWKDMDWTLRKGHAS